MPWGAELSVEGALLTGAAIAQSLVMRSRIVFLRREI